MVAIFFLFFARWPGRILDDSAQWFTLLVEILVIAGFFDEVEVVMGVCDHILAYTIADLEDDDRLVGLV